MPVNILGTTCGQPSGATIEPLVRVDARCVHRRIARDRPGIDELRNDADEARAIEVTGGKPAAIGAPGTPHTAISSIIGVLHGIPY